MGSMYEAAKHLLTSPTFTGRFDPFIRPPVAESGSGTIIWDSLLEEAKRYSLSRGENVLLEIAWQLGTGRRGSILGEGEATFADLSSLDTDHQERVLDACAIRFGLDQVATDV